MDAITCILGCYAMLQLKNIVKTYVTGDLTQDALQDVSINFRQNEFVSILGQSGSGKTVLMKSVVGIHEVDRGNIIYDNRDVTRMRGKEKNRFRREIGMLFQGSALFDSLTVLSIAPLIARAIREVFEDGSVTSLFDGNA